MLRLLSFFAIILFFVAGNIVWVLDLPNIVIYNLEIPIIQILSSELSFIIIYTIIDKGNLKYGLGFTLLSVLLVGQFILPIYSDMFYSKNVQYFSVSISVLAIIINSIVIRKMVNRGLSKLLSSRVSTATASVVEISFFAFLLNIGVQGAISTVIVRSVYIYLIPKLFFHKQ